jgi:uncharacterized protein
MISHLLYLHGFRSSPQSTKARQMKAWVDAHRTDLHWWCPQLPPSPAQALSLLRDGVSAWPTAHTAVIGSSLGGFYATVLTEERGFRAALLNPAVDPARDLAAHCGDIQAWHSEERFRFEPAFVDQLRDMTPTLLTRADNYFAVIAKGDEVLDWREMQARYAACRVLLLEGSDHALSQFENQLDAVVDAVGLRRARLSAR